MFESLTSQKNFSLERLVSLCVVAKHGSIGEAAGKDSNYQTQLSRQIKELETFFEVDLLDRSIRPHRLTDEGQTLSRIAMAFLSSLESFQAQPSEGKSLKGLVIGAGESLIQWALMPNIDRFQKAVPDAKFIFKNMPTSRIVSGLTDGSLDLGFVRGSAVKHPLRKRAGPTLEHRLFVPKALLGKKKRTRLKLSNLEAFPLATMEGDGEFRSSFDRMVKKADVEPDIRLECSSFTQIALAVNRLGMCGILPSLAEIQIDKKKIEVCVMDGLDQLDWTFSVAWNPSKAEIIPAIEHLVKAVA